MEKLIALTLNKKEEVSLTQWLLYKYKYLWGVGDKGRDLSLLEEVSQTYTLKLY